MPPMPPDFYIPAFTALITAMGFLVAVGGKIILTLWNRHLLVSDRSFNASMEQTKALNATSDSLNNQTKTINEVKEVVKGIQNELAKGSLTNSERSTFRQNSQG